MISAVALYQAEEVLNAWSDKAREASLEVRKAKALEKVSKLEEVPRPSSETRSKQGPFVRNPLAHSISSQELDKELRGIISKGSRQSKKVDLAELVGTQSSLDKPTLEHMIRSVDKKPEVLFGAKQLVPETEPAIVVKLGNRSYIYDGHHRLAAKKLVGDKKVIVHYYS